MIAIVVLISGHGSNLQAIIDATHRGLAVKILSVLSSSTDAYGLKRAQAAGIQTHVLCPHHFDSRTAFDTALAQQLAVYQPDLIVLAGFMYRLSAQLVTQYAGHIVNIHPSLLPKYPGLHTYQQVLAAGDPEHGTTIHFVTPQLDAGPIIAQQRCPVKPDDTETSLKARVQALEQELYPFVLQHFAEGRLSLKGSTVLLDQHPIKAPLSNARS